MLPARISFYIAAVICVASLSLAEDPPQDAQEKRNAQLTEVYRQHAASYIMKLTDSGVKIDLQPTSVFNWLNPARVGTPRLQHGAVYLWTRQGRAEAIGTVFSSTAGNAAPYLYHEFHSLAVEPVKAVRDGTSHWNTQQAGIEPKPVTNAQAPGGSRTLRMTQMRQIARRFSGYSINCDEKRWELTLLPQPLHRNDDGHKDVMDGALFTLVSTAGTDPEVLLVIEARKADNDWQWRYSVCRFTDLKTWVKLDDTEVWAFANGTQGPYVDSGASNRYRFSSEDTITLPVSD
jgi:hypothetical protein